MKLHKLARIHLAAAAFLAAAPLATAASAQSAITPGTQVVDPSGNAVGTVIAVKGNELIVKTDRHEVQLPATSFTPNEGKLLFAMSQAQLNAETDRALAEAEASLAAGAAVHGSGGQLAGHIEEIDDSMVTVKLTSGELIRLPRSGIAPAQHGAVLGVTAEELRAMAAPAGSAQADAPSADAAPADAAQGNGAQ